MMDARALIACSCGRPTGAEIRVRETGGGGVTARETVRTECLACGLPIEAAEGRRMERA